MGFYILEPRGNVTHVPGTTLLDVHDQRDVDNSRFIKKGTGRNAHVVLVPQPSNDPNDPLNWPTWQKDMLLLMYCAGTLLASGGIGPIMSPLYVPIIMEFHVTFQQVSLLTGYSLLATGCAGIFVSAVVCKYGKRMPLLFSLSCGFAGCVWAGAAQSYSSLLGARILQGFQVSLFESVIFAVVGDLYFVHERGSRTAFYVCCLSAIGNIPPLASGKVAQDLGWRWCFHLVALFMGVVLVWAIVLGWETTYNRDAIYNIDTSSQDNLEMVEEIKGHEAEHSEVVRAETRESTTPRTREGFLARMKPYHGSFSETSILTMLIKPFVIAANPAVVWAVIMLAFPILWLVGISLVNAQIFSAPPYSLTTAQLGYLSSGPIIGGTLACILCGWLSDFVAKTMSRKNGGVYEPEFRLLLVGGLAFVSTLGYFLFGNLITQGTSVVGIVAIFAVIAAGPQFAAVTVGTYMVDAFRDISVQIFILTMIVKNMLFFGFSYFINDWLVSWGPAKMFDCIGGIMIGICALTIPLFFYGKRIRHAWHNASTLRNL